ncbi:MAG: S1 family peptidase [Beijerinckiaceae bacterium]|nr:S1 family peptidase [Beijerinckiaceae bacterium]
MYNSSMPANFFFARHLGALPRSRCFGLSKMLACLWIAVLEQPASALVGPAREAPQFAPYTVMVKYGSGDDTSFCTASVIASNAVLTAAHCVSGLGDTRVFYRGSQGKLILFDATAIAIHPGYIPNAARRHLVSIDLALVRLGEPLPAAFKPVEIADSGEVTIGQRLQIAGFGRGDEEMSGTSGVLRAGILVTAGPKSKSLAWLVDPDGTGLGGCTGDSGAPIFRIGEPQLIAVAIRAKGNNGYACGAITEAVQIWPQRPWIQATLRAWGIEE